MEMRVWAWTKFLFTDHALLRALWSNLSQISPGVYRANQPGRIRLRRYAGMGIRTIINLRGEAGPAYDLFERQDCEKLGIELLNCQFFARSAISRKRMIALIKVLKDAEKPILLHCKSGADRSGFAAAVYLLVVERSPIAEAKKQLSLRYLHLAFSKAGVQGYVLRTFEERQDFSVISFEDWVETEYSGKMLQRGWDEKEPPRQIAQELMDA